jgi:hypothetical protein
MSTLPIPGGILGSISPAYGAVTGQGLGGLLPYMSPLAMLMGAGGHGGGGGDAAVAPGTAPAAPSAPAAPTLATNAQPAPAMVPPPMPKPNLTGQAPVDIGDHPLTPQGGGDLASMAAGLPHADLKRHGVGGILDAIKNPEFSAEALRFAAGAFKGGIGNGILAATDFADKRRAEHEDARRYDSDHALRERGAANDERQTDITGRHYDRSDANQRYNIDVDSSTTRRGQDVSERGNIRDNSVRLTTNREDNATSRANTRDSVGASITNNTADNTTATNIAAGNQQTDRDVANINAGAKNRLDPKDAMHGLGTMLPGMLNTQDAEGVAKALQAAPDLQAQLIDAYTNAWGDGSGNAADRARQAIAGVLGNGASYTDDNSWLPFHGSPAISRGQPSGGQGGGDAHHYADMSANPGSANPKPQTPNKGDRVDGYTFLGGDPADPRSWRK